jgi:iron complex transport system substrate-binding protein
METSPLGRAEWMRFFGILFGKEDAAEEIFSQVEKEYLMLAEKSGKLSVRPTLLVDNVQSGAWYVPCGQSTMGVLFRDAGANYVFSYLDGSGSQTLSPETVLQHGRNADLWIIKYGAPQDISYESLAADFALYRELKAWKERNVFGCNVSKTPFFEETPFHPERLLRDITSIVAHSASKSAKDKSWTDSLRYFKPL